MMFSRVLALTSMASLTVLGAAMPGGVKPTTTITVAPGPTSIPADKCSTGPVQCCNQVQKVCIHPRICIFRSSSRTESCTPHPPSPFPR